MSFRKRNVAVTRTPQTQTSDAQQDQPQDAPSPLPQSFPGTRPSPLTGQPVTSTGTPSFDSILAGHAGLALGSLMLVEEEGTTDYAGVLCRLFAAQGVVHGHQVHVVGVPEGWGRELPGVVEDGTKGAEKEPDREKMKIAWRYERLGGFGERSGRAPGSPRTASQPSSSGDSPASTGPAPFSHTFDLAKRLTLPPEARINFLTLSPNSPNPFTSVLREIQSQLTASPTTLHRVIIPGLLNPALWPPTASLPQHLLQFFHSMRSLLRQFATRLVAMVSLPVSLYPRSTGLIRWVELLSDGVFELVPFPHIVGEIERPGKDKEEQPQGMLRVHRLPVFHERGGGATVGLGEDLAFTVSRRKFLVKPFSLPPVEGDTEAQAEGGMTAKKSDMEF